MKEKKTVREKTIVIDIKLTRRVVVVLACILTTAALLAYLTLSGESAAASGETSPAQSIGTRQFYLTQLGYYGDEALTACAEGYHFASLWELADPSNLKYNRSLGLKRGDSGEGPPQWYGWVRTGYQLDISDTPGRANCDGWASRDEEHYGTVVTLPPDWTVGHQDIGVWSAWRYKCSWQVPVYCIEN